MIAAALCKSELHHIVNTDSGEKIFYGDLVAKAALMEIPQDPVLKSPDEFIYIGKRLKSVDAGDFVKGIPKYGLDIRLKEMVYACIARCPVTFGSVISYDDSDSLKITGSKDRKYTG